MSTSRRHTPSTSKDKIQKDATHGEEIGPDTNDEDQEDYDEIDRDQFMPLPKLSDVAPKLPDPLKLVADESDSLVDTIETVFLSNAGGGSSSKVGRRASNVLKLSQENDNLKAQLRELTERLEAAERKRAALAIKTGAVPANSTPNPIAKENARQSLGETPKQADDEVPQRPTRI